MSTPAEVAERGPARKGGGYQKPVGRGNFEVISWFFMRISGLVLVLLVGTPLILLVWPLTR